MSRTAPEGFTEFVVARSTSLHRTAVLLTHGETSAEDLVQTALVKACRSWHQKQSGHEAYVRRIMVNEFATRWRRRWQSEQPFAAVPQAVSPDPSDGVSIHQMVLAALAALPPRQRAIVVLSFFHDYTEPMAAEALGISVGTVKSQTARALAALRISEQLGEAPGAQPVPPRGGPWSLTATLEDLRAALRESAEQSSCPDPSLTLAEVARGVAAAERRRRGEVAAVAAAVLVLGSGFLAWDDGRARAPVHLASVVTDDPAFPAYERGLKRLTILDLPLAEGARAVVSTREREKNLLHIVAYCAGADVSGKLLSVTSGGRQMYVPCRSVAQASTRSGIPVLWRPDDAGDQLLLQPTRRTRGGGHATIAVYQEVGWDDYRFPPRPHDLETSPHTAWTARPGTPVYRGPLDASRPNAPLAVTVPYEKGMRVRLHARAPGALRVTVNGRFLTLYCVGPVGPAVCGSPSGKTFTQWGYGAAEAGNWLDAAAPGLRPGQKVTITAYPSSFASDDWRLEVGTRKR